VQHHVTMSTGLQDRRDGVAAAARQHFDGEKLALLVTMAEKEDFVAVGFADGGRELLPDQV